MEVWQVDLSMDFLLFNLLLVGSLIPSFTSYDPSNVYVLLRQSELDFLAHSLRQYLGSFGTILLKLLLDTSQNPV